jgi:hypothetical protein
LFGQKRLPTEICVAKPSEIILSSWLEGMYKGSQLTCLIFQNSFQQHSLFEVLVTNVN